MNGSSGLALLSAYSSDDESSVDEEPKQPVQAAKPPPRKVQIKIDALPKDDEAAPAPKSMLKPSAGSSHSLFGMLPPPQRKDSEVRAEREQIAKQRKVERHSEQNEDDDDDLGAASGPLSIVQEAPSDGKTKNNDAFRAMLGLKSSATATQRSAAPAAPSIPTLPQAEEAAPVAPKPKPRPSFQISAAPEIVPAAAEEEDEEAYPGWKLDLDGSWVPVTPEAQAHYHAYLATTAPPPLQKRKRANDNLDGTRDLLSAGINPDDIRSFDASSAARAAFDASGDGQDTDKYAAAAEFAAGNREATAPKPGHLRGLRRGQLSTLVNMANENRSSLEQKWQRGREARSRAGNQYGF